jgi:choline kinase
MRAVILAAGRGTRLEPITNDMPKCLVPVGGVALLDRMLERLTAVDIDDIVIVAGHCADALSAHLAASADPAAQRAQVVINDRYAEWGNFYSLLVAQDMLWDEDFIKIDGDVLVDDKVLPTLIAARGPAVLTIDSSVELGDEEMKARADERGHIVELSKQLDPALAIGESIGVERIDAEVVPTIFAELRSMIDDDETDEYYERAYARLMQQGVDFGYADVAECVWCEIDDAADLAHANRLVAGE